MSDNAKGNKDIQRGMQKTAETKKQSETSRTQKLMNGRLSFFEDEPDVNVWLRRQPNNRMTCHIGLTCGLPLFFVHFTVSVGVNDLHPGHKRSEFGMLAELGEHVVELSAIFKHQLVFARQSGRVINPIMSGRERKKNLPNKVIPKDEIFGHVLYSILEPEHVTETEPGQFIVVGNWSLGADVVNVVAK